ncbi:BPI fold-containing family C protein-like [Hyla sarda]|uniref:BPI fold-containing family C protein-like n=1 Tax=Hyla sarda TaxID=327740 RepID=UPI0024C219E4|nr:BPI fold-containing family C protein-like [Hyla sarda]
MMWVPNITFLLLTLSISCYGDNPGAKIQVTERGLQKGVEYLLNKMMANNTVYPLPDVSGSENIASEDMGYEFTQIRIIKFYRGTVASQWVPGTGMQVSMQNGNATITCNWKLDSWLIKDSGSSVLTLTGLAISMVLEIDRIDPGVPSMAVVDCQASVQNVDVQMLGGVSYIMDSIKQPVQDVVKKTVSQQLCSSIRNQVDKWDQSVSHLKLNSSLNRFIEADFSLVNKPEILGRYANIGLKGLFRLHNESHSETTFSPEPMTLPDQDGAMIYIGASQSSFDSLAAAYYSAGFLTFQVSQMAGSKEFTTSELSAYMPEISQHFPDPVPVKIQMHATRAPLAFILVNNMTVQFGGLLETIAHPAKAEAENIFGVNIVVSVQANFILSEANGARGLNLTGSIELVRLQIEGSQQTIKVQKGVVTENGVQRLFREVVVPVVNENLASGVLIPSTFLKNASVRMEQGFAILAAELK